MRKFDRLPAVPLIANDPYFSVWLPADLPTDANTVHWTGAPKWIRGHVVVDGVKYRWLGKNGIRAVKTVEVAVTPTKTRFVMEAAGIELTAEFISPMLPDDLDILSTPITFAEFSAKSLDGAEHQVQLELVLPHSLCYDGASRPAIRTDAFRADNLNIAYAGQASQKVLCHSGDMITIDWGYLYAASELPVKVRGESIACEWSAAIGKEPQSAYVMLGYDDIASINYFGALCHAWYARNGKTLVDAFREFAASHDEIIARCASLDASVLDDARRIGGEDYALIISAAWRHTVSAHKLIATPEGKMALLSKENNSNGCIGTVDVSYPSTPMFLKYCPELVNALCLPILEFANMPVWEFDFAPHDVGRYPYATGEVYSLNDHLPCGHVYPPYYMYGAGSNVYTTRRSMPVEECGNMLVMIYTAIHFGADDSMAKKYLPTLDKWVRYLDEYGEDPGEQLCTDDFAGHLAHNVNLSAKAIMGVACYGRILAHLGDKEGGAKWTARAKEMADSWYKRVGGVEYAPLTFDGKGWSMKYNLAWDLVLKMDLIPKDFYARETRSYVPRVNEFGLPLDSRADYTKSDWILWCAAMAQDEETRNALIAPVAHYLRNTRTRVPFSDWYDTVRGDFVEFIARSVQGGLFMPMLTAE
ncbi:MAG: DUF4965 domain-containing protein [Clostridia bacterium]|nr:DUF4965 domain-containing protein [Clostridia bacterium]